MTLSYVDFIHCLHRIYASRKNLLDYTNLLSPNGYKRNNKITDRDFKDKFFKR